jgi:hypothetical protein
LRALGREAPLDGFVKIVQEILKRLSLRGAAGNGRDFRPIPALLRLMDYDFDLHRGSSNFRAKYTAQEATSI